MPHQPLFLPEINNVDACIACMTAELEVVIQEKCDEELHQAEEVEWQVEEEWRRKRIGRGRWRKRRGGGQNLSNGRGRGLRRGRGGA